MAGESIDLDLLRMIKEVDIRQKNFIIVSQSHKKTKSYKTNTVSNIMLSICLTKYLNLLTNETLYLYSYLF